MAQTPKRSTSDLLPQRTHSQTAPPSERMAPTAPSVRESAQPVEEPIPTRGAPVPDRLPESYLQDRVWTLFQAPDTLVVYWDVHPETARRYTGRQWGIRLRTHDSEEVIPVTGGARNWYIHKPDLTHFYEVAFGPLDEAGRVIPIATTTWSRPTDRQLPAWGRPEKDADGAVRLNPIPEPEVRADSAALRAAAESGGGAASAAWSGENQADSR